MHEKYSSDVPSYPDTRVFVSWAATLYPFTYVLSLPCMALLYAVEDLEPRPRR
jgi:hypothetical protein